MVRKISFCIILVLFLLACATPAKYDRRLQSWVGKSEEELLRKWGAPGASKYLSGKEKVITYTRAENIYVPSEFYIYNQGLEPSEDVLYAPFVNEYDFSPFGQIFGYEVKNYCQTSFFIRNGIISGWKWKGNNCVAD